MAVSQVELYEAEDSVLGTILFPNDVVFNRTGVLPCQRIYRKIAARSLAKKGIISFSVFGNQFNIENATGGKLFFR